MFQSNAASSNNENASNDYCHSLTSQTIESLTNFQTFPTPIDQFQQKLHLQLTNSSHVSGGQSHSMAKNQQHMNKTILTQYLTGGCSSSSANRSSKNSANSYFAMKQAMLNKLQKRNCSKSVRDSDENNNNNNCLIRSDPKVEELVQFIEGKPIENSDLNKTDKDKHGSSKSKKRRTKNKQYSGDDDKERKSDDSSVVVDDGYVSPDNQYQSQLNEQYNSENCVCSLVRENLVSPHDFIDQSSSSDISQCTRCPGDDCLSNVANFPCNDCTLSADFSNVLSSSMNDFDNDEILVVSFSADQSAGQHSASTVYEETAIVASKAVDLNGKLVDEGAISRGEKTTSYEKEYTTCQNGSAKVVSENVSGRPKKNFSREHRHLHYPENVNKLHVNDVLLSQPDTRGDYRDVSRNFYPRHRYFNGRQGAVHPSSSSGSFTTLADFLPADLHRTSSLSSSSHVYQPSRMSIAVNTKEPCVDNLPSPMNNPALSPYKSMPVENSSNIFVNATAPLAPSSQQQFLHSIGNKISYALVASDRKSESKILPSKVDNRQPSTSTHTAGLPITTAEGSVLPKAAFTSTNALSPTSPEIFVQQQMDQVPLPLLNRRQTSCSPSSFSGTAVVEFLDNKSDEMSDAAARLIASQVSFGFLDEPEWPLKKDEQEKDDRAATVLVEHGSSFSSSLTMDQPKKIEKENKFVQKNDDRMFKMRNARNFGDKEMLKFVEKAWTKFVANSNITYYGQS